MVAVLVVRRGAGGRSDDRKVQLNRMRSPVSFLGHRPFISAYGGSRRNDRINSHINVMTMGHSACAKEMKPKLEVGEED